MKARVDFGPASLITCRLKVREGHCKGPLVSPYGTPRPEKMLTPPATRFLTRKTGTACTGSL